MARGRIVIDLFTTLDGVAQAPGGPDEDPSGGFPYGGWQATFDDEIIGADVGAGIRLLRYAPDGDVAAADTAAD